MKTTLLTLLLISSPVFANTDARIAALEARITYLEKRIELLERTNQRTNAPRHALLFTTLAAYLYLATPMNLPNAIKA